MVNVFNLGKENVEKMRGRSRITFIKKIKRLLRDIYDEYEDADLLTRAKWLRAAAGHHTRMANKLIMVARYMKNKAADTQRTAEMRLLSYKTAVAHKELAGKLSNKGKADTDPKGPHPRMLGEQRNQADRNGSGTPWIAGQH